MSSHAKSHPRRVLAMLPAMIAVLCTFATLAAAQDRPLPKWELYGGYSLFYPGADVHGKLPGALLPLSSRLETNPRGAGGSVTYNYNRWLGFTLDSSTHWGSGENTTVSKIDDAGFTNVSFGPKLTYRTAHFAPFIEAMAGWHRLNSDLFGSSDKLGFIGGGGIDVPVSKHFGLRLIRGDYVYSEHHFGPASVVPSTKVEGVRLQSGLMFMFGGGEEAAPVAASCSVSPSEVMVGESVTANVTVSNFNPKHPLTYNWSSTGGKVSGTNNTATIDTNGVAGGNYTVSARVADPKMKKGGEASCSSNFTVKEPVKNPPTITCSANPSTVQPGGSSTITSRANSPDGRNLTYSYSASAGSISGTSESTTLNTAGAALGTITVTCNTLDDRNLSASSTTTVTVEAPPPPPSAPEASKLNQIDFKMNSPRVDNAAKAILDDVALRMQRDADARVVLVGESASNEKGAKRLAEQRAVNTKAYLTKEKGIDPNRIEVRSGNAGTMQTEIWLVPAGATFNGDGTTVVSEQAAKPARKKK